jgi:hypothetical protein
LSFAFFSSVWQIHFCCYQHSRAQVLFSSHLLVFILSDLV